MDDSILLFLCGLHSFALVIFHLFFWKILRWKTELAKLGVINRGVMQIMNVQLIALFIAVGVACFYFGGTLNDGAVGRFFLGAIAVFWLLRLVQQFIFLKQDHWVMHVLSGAFALGAVLFGWAGLV
jgi:hypothetical protein